MRGPSMPGNATSAVINGPTSIGRRMLPLDGQVWQTIMEKMFADWSEEQMCNGQQCRLLDSYIQTAANVTASLASCKIIKEHEVAAVEARLRNQLSQPGVREDSKALWLYHAGGKHKYLTFGCIHCHRATTLWYSDENFQQVLEWYFWS